MDRETVIKGLEQFRSDFKPFCGNSADWARVDAALAMLKEQPEIVRCKDCKYAILTYSGECKYCKKRIDDDGGMDQLYFPGDWYCADGERKDGDGK